MILFLVLMLEAVAGDNLLVRPSPVVPGANECPRSLSITKGQPAPVAVFKNGVAVCDAVIEPTSSLAFLLALEKYERGMSQLHALDIRLIEAERDWLKAELENEATSKKWLEKPAVNRWIGRVEMLATVAVVAGLGSFAYYSQNGTKK